MNNYQLYNTLSLNSSKLVTRSYSTSFSHGVRMLHKDLRLPIHAIYGFVRVADEIVDTFHDQPQEELLNEFKKDTYIAIERGFSLNPVLQSFQWVVNKYGIDREFIDTFLRSMEMDLYKAKHDEASYDAYILGSAQVVGLMCLRVFCNNDKALFENLKPHAMSLGSAFQKVNFLRDIKADVEHLGRLYFPNVSFESFDEAAKESIEREIKAEFDDALIGIQQLPLSSRLGVYTAYTYYLGLLDNIMQSSVLDLFSKRIRVSNAKKLYLMFRSKTAFKMGMI